MKIYKALVFRTIFKIPVIGIIAFGGVSAYETMSSFNRIASLQSNQSQASEAADSLLASLIVKHPSEWIGVATVLSAQGAANDYRSIELLERALAGAPDNANAWTLLSFLRARRANAFTKEAGKALRESNLRCPLCDKAILQWRLTFTLQHWDQSAEDIRMSAFNGADFLRWWHLEYAYLSEVRASAKAMDIPFDEYRRKVNTKVRPNEIP